MAALSGFTDRVAYVAAPGPTTPTSPGNKGAGAPAQPTAGFPAVIDGTPVRVVVIALASAAGLYALKLAGFRFNVGVSV